MKRAPLAERLSRRSLVTPYGCWLWTGAVDPTGYGRIFIGPGRMGYTHRVSYELNVGPIPDGHDVDHLCRNRRCVNPTHLDAVTRSVNLRRGAGNGGALNVVHSRSKGRRAALAAAGVAVKAAS